MDDYLEYEKETNELKSINLDNFSIEELNNYILELNTEIERVNKEIQKKEKLQKEASKYFK